ncbi:tetratricopeptide repeat protein [Streptomyces sp. NBC_01317]|uniref:tetratricopeptide repeat protein n=1 Tax=Streptomyces sp. NBC_01317 TaxID=2903822 RepID=UPI002E11D0D6|nr:tetratricopeptide repeat protein [Streptomyces sp. NBC_01317]
MPLTTYRRLFDDRRETLSDLLPATSPADEHTDTVETAWKPALDRAEAFAPARSARAALELVSMLAPDGIPEAVLHTTAARGWIEAAMTAHGDGAHQDSSHRNTDPHPRSAERAVLLALRALHRLSLITHEGTHAPSRTPASVEVHALVQRATRETVPAPALPALAVAAAADAIEELWSGTAESPHGPDTEAALYRGVESLRRTAPGGLLRDGRRHPVLRRVGPYLAELGRYAAERDVSRELLAQARATLGDGHRDVLVLRGQVARATGESGEAATALASLVEIRREAERTLGPSDPDTLTVRLHETRFRMEAGAVADALDHFTALADRAATVLGADHSLVTDARRNAALCRSLTGDAGGARDACAAIATAVERQFGPGHPVTLSVLTDLGRHEGEAGDPREAVATYVRAVAGLEAAVGRLHRDTLIARHNLAYWRGLSGDTAAAATELALLRPTVDEVLGPDHPRALRTRQQQAEVPALAGDHTGSAALLTTLLTDMTRVHGEDHPRTREVATALEHAEGPGP